MYINNLVDIINEYNNTYHSTIEMKIDYVNSSIFIDFGVENNDKGTKYKVVDRARISKYKNILLKLTLPIGLKKFLWIKKLRTLCCTHVIEDFNGEKTVGTFYEKEIGKEKSNRNYNCKSNKEKRWEIIC